MNSLAARADLLGTETAFTVLARAAALAAEGRDIINLGIGQPDFPTPEHIVEAGIKALRDGAHGYTPSGGTGPLRQAVAADLNQRYGAGVETRHIQILPGGKVVIFFAAMLTGEDGGEILYPDPGFPIYASAVRFSGATPRPYPLSEDNDFAFSADDVLSRITPRTRLVMINSPANPTGGVTPRAEIEKLVRGLADHPHVMLMSDEIYDRLVFDGAAMTSLLEFPEIRDRLIILNGWSKTYAMTGWRLGYAVWPESMIDAADRLAVNIHSCVNAAAQEAALTAITGPQDCVEDMRQAFGRRARLLEEGLNALPGFSCRKPAGAFYAFPNISGTGLSSTDLQTGLLEEAGVALISGTSFGDEGEGYLRFSCANSDEAISEALGRIEDWLGRRG
ncbi:MAG: pyridoxal phosphate-dependent aminotransferase [Candidatus Puniceispirillales bacterium]